MCIRGKYRLNRRSIRKLICALMCAIAVYLTKGASYDPQEAELCRQEICHLELICATLPEDISYVEVPPFEYYTLKKYLLGKLPPANDAQRIEIADNFQLPKVKRQRRTRRNFTVPVAEMAKILKTSPETLRRRINEHPELERYMCEPVILTCIKAVESWWQSYEKNVAIAAKEAREMNKASGGLRTT